MPQLDHNYLNIVHTDIIKHKKRQHQVNLQDLNWSSVPLWTDNRIKKKLKQINLYPSKIRIFVWDPLQKYFPWHVDGKPNLPGFLSVNWVISGKGMIQWNPDIDLSEHWGQVYAGRTPSDGKDCVVSQSDGHGCLINTFIPHRVVNSESNSRFSLTLQFNNGGIPFTEAVEKFCSVGLLY